MNGKNRKILEIGIDLMFLIAIIAVLCQYTIETHSFDIVSVLCIVMLTIIIKDLLFIKNLDVNFFIKMKELKDENNSKKEKLIKEYNIPWYLKYSSIVM